jgi:hypothetical protein
MELTEGSETSANHNMTPGKYPKEYIQYSKHGQSLKSRKLPGSIKYGEFLEYLRNYDLLKDSNP